MSKKRHDHHDDDFAFLPDEPEREPAAKPGPEPMPKATEPKPLPVVEPTPKSLACPRCQSENVMLWKLKTHVCRQCGHRFEAEPK